MEYFVLGDEDTVLGFRYAGVDGKAVHSPDEAREALADQVKQGRAGVIFITDEIAATISTEFNRLRFESRMPIVVQIPGPAGPAPGRPDLIALIREAMGIKL